MSGQGFSHPFITFQPSSCALGNSPHCPLPSLSTPIPYVPYCPGISPRLPFGPQCARSLPVPAFAAFAVTLVDQLTFPTPLPLLSAEYRPSVVPHGFPNQTETCESRADLSRTVPQVASSNHECPSVQLRLCAPLPYPRLYLCPSLFLSSSLFFFLPTTFLSEISLFHFPSL